MIARDIGTAVMVHSHGTSNGSCKLRGQASKGRKASFFNSNDQNQNLSADMEFAAKSYNAMLSISLTWRGRWLDKSANHALNLSDRDVLLIGLIMQFIGGDVIIVDDQVLFEALSDAFEGDEAPQILCGLASDSDESSNTLILAHVSRMMPVQARAAQTVHLVYGLADGFNVPEPNAETWIRPLSGINPCLWNSGLALTASRHNHDVIKGLCQHLGAILGDQSLDPLPLYEENCRLRQALQSSKTAAMAAREQSLSISPERALFELRHSVQALIERGAFAERRLSARSGIAVMDWSSAFAKMANAGGALQPQADPLDEAEIRARHARTEAEFLRGQLRAYMPERNVSHHDLVAMSGFFDILWYSETYSILPQETIQHYLDVGFKIGNDPSPIFSTQSYFAVNSDVAALGFNPLVHYLMDGIYEGRPLHPPLEVTEDVWRDGFA